MIKKLVIVTAILLSFIVFIVPQAVKGKTQESEDAQNQETKKEKFLEKCHRIEDQIKSRSQKTSSSRERFITSLNNATNRIEKLIANAKRKGYDTSQLEEDLKTFKAMITEFDSTYAPYVKKVAMAQSYSCGKSDADFRAKLKETKQQLKIAHQKAKEIRAFWKDVIRKDLTALKAFKPSPSPYSIPSPSGESL